MPQYHDPQRQTDYLRQCLAQDKKPLGLFLGAGCPLAIRVSNDEGSMPLIPDIAGLTKAVCDEMGGSEYEPYFRTLCGQFEADGRSAPTIEDYLSQIRSLRQVAGTDLVRGLTADQLDRLDKLMCDAIVRIVSKPLPGPQTPYHRIAAWVGSIPRSHPVQVFTPNYDLLMEQALEETRVPYFDGFVGSRRTFFDPHAMEEDLLPARWARLWKLHGSINWRQTANGVVWRGELQSDDERRLIHPSHLKYDESRRMPYLAMIDRLRSFLRQPAGVLLICGYSFRDAHLNEVMIQGLQGNPTAMAFALLYGDLDGYPLAVSMACGRPNLTLLARNCAVIGTSVEGWIVRDDIESNDATTVAVEWVPVQDDGSGSMRKARFRLGDFARFSEFVRDLMGTTGGISNEQSNK